MARTPYIIRDGDPSMLKRLHELLDGLRKNKVWQVTVEPYKTRRSLNQNALYWRWLSILAEETGHDNDDLHEFFKAKFLEPRTVDLHGEEIAVRSTAKLAADEFKLYLDKVYAFVTSELGILLPLPEEQHVRAA